jgi:hypothetical protein
MPPPLPRRCRLRPRHNVEQDLLPTVNGYLAISDWQAVRYRTGCGGGRLGQAEGMRPGPAGP